MSPLLVLLSGGAVLCCGISVGIFVHTLLVQPLLAAPVHGLRGLKRARARNAVNQFASFEPLMRWLAARISPLLSMHTREKLAEKITIAGEVWGLWPAELRALSVLSGLAITVCAGAAVLLMNLNAPIAALCFCIGIMLPDLQLSSTGRARVRTISRRIPHIVDLLVLALGAGLDFPAALRQVVERSADPESDVIEELGLVLEELKLGSTRRYALEQLARRAPCDEVRDLVAAAVQSEEQGTPLGVVLATQASTSRQRRSARAEETASKAATALLLPLLLLFVALIVLMIGPVAFDAMQSQGQLEGF